MRTSLNLAQIQADRLKEALRPFMTRIEVAGSVRRCKPQVHDIELVAIRNKDRLFDLAAEFRKPGWKAIKGGAGGKMIQFSRTPYSDQLDLFFATERNWGFILAIRTGSADFSKHLACEWVKKGYHGRDGMLTKQGFPIDVPDEKYLFHLLALDFVPPEQRF